MGKTVIRSERQRQVCYLSKGVKFRNRRWPCYDNDKLVSWERRWFVQKGKDRFVTWAGWIKFRTRRRWPCYDNNKLVSWERRWFVQKGKDRFVTWARWVKFRTRRRWPRYLRRAVTGWNKKTVKGEEVTKPTLLPEEDGDTQGGQVLLHDVPAGLHHLNLLRSQVLVQVLSLGARAVKACHRLCVTHGSGFQCPTGFTCLKVRVTSACYCDNDVRFGFESPLKQIFLLFSFFFLFCPTKTKSKGV